MDAAFGDAWVTTDEEAFYARNNLSEAVRHAYKKETGWRQAMAATDQMRAFTDIGVFYTFGPEDPVSACQIRLFMEDSFAARWGNYIVVSIGQKFPDLKATAVSGAVRRDTQAHFTRGKRVSIVHVPTFEAAVDAYYDALPHIKDLETALALETRCHMLNRVIETERYEKMVEVKRQYDEALRQPSIR